MVAIHTVRRRDRPDSGPPVGVFRFPHFTHPTATQRLASNQFSSLQTFTLWLAHGIIFSTTHHSISDTTVGNMGRPGAMLVQSQPTTGGITNSNLERWYLDKHIPEVLDTGGVRGVIFCQINRESSKNYSGESQPKLYLAVYLLPDLDWLHEEGCGLWNVALVLGSDDADLESKHKGRSVFDVAEFATDFWEVVDSPHEGMLSPQFMAAAPDGGSGAKGECHASWP